MPFEIGIIKMKKREKNFQDACISCLEFNKGCNVGICNF